MARQFVQIDDYRVVNIKHIHSITMNKDGRWGWVKVIDEDRFGKYKISPDMFDSLRKFLLNAEDVIVKEINTDG